ncbi:MAG TPA: chromate resistance protein ChrB domain-containing protein [Ktedonobacterales bacterium]|nr:chromate resistance protein ChrB domain-containing protein [Ktedonobacterales bacterium]
MACARLIRMFLDADAEFVFVSEGAPSLPEHAAQAEPFDIPGTRLSHRQGHSSFHTMLQEYHLDDPVLARIARLVDEADMMQDVSLEPAAPGLDLICRDLRRISADDREALERGAMVYDALYAELGASIS